ncbi:MAG: hypothetical protein HZB20_06865, partial [Chloroflexi bacterium]|nr:hypothetical protein [Chloroflexota bacterium]
MDSGQSSTVVAPSLNTQHSALKTQNSNPYLAGLAAALLMVVLGNLGELQVISAALTGVAADVHRWPIPFLGDLQQMAVGLWRIYVEHASIPIGTGSWYWNATRVIPDSSVQPITEFPFFTFLYADLHAHMIVLSSVMVALAWAASVVLSARAGGAGQGARRRWIEPAALWLVGGLAFGVIAPSNLSDYQTYWMLGCVAIIYAQLRKHETIDLKFIVAVVWRCALLIGLAVLFFKPYAAWRGEGYGSVEVWKGDKTDISSYLTVHGLFLFHIVSLLIVETRRWMQKTKVDEVREWVMPGLFAVLAFVAMVAELMLLGYS